MVRTECIGLLYRCALFSRCCVCSLAKSLSLPRSHWRILVMSNSPDVTPTGAGIAGGSTGAFGDPPTGSLLVADMPTDLPSVGSVPLSSVNLTPLPPVSSTPLSFAGLTTTLTPPASETPTSTGGQHRSSRMIIAVAAVGALIGLMGIVIFYVRYRTQKQHRVSVMSYNPVIRPGAADSPTPSSGILPRSTESRSSKAHSERTQSTSMSTMSGISYNSESHFLISAIPSDLQTITGTSLSRSTSRSNSRYQSHSSLIIPPYHLPHWASRTTSQRQSQQTTGSDWSHLPVQSPPDDVNGMLEPMPDDAAQRIEAAAGERWRA
ncbi:hypothetical protein DENSPDRAFT_598056 [Dentipellis sp. KUC8613]|nr:hypothetical protein DENSPDRAFT_598056 [Dentipellis sp. KUC8613]